MVVSVEAPAVRLYLRVADLVKSCDLGAMAFLRSSTSELGGPLIPVRSGIAPSQNCLMSSISLVRFRYNRKA